MATRTPRINGFIWIKLSLHTRSVRLEQQYCRILNKRSQNFVYAVVAVASLVFYPATGCQAGIISSFTSMLRKHQVNKEISYIARPSMLTWKYLSFYRAIARHHVSFDSSNAPAKVNEPYNGEGTVLYITKPQLSNELPEQMQRNCTVLSGTSVIVCDGLFLQGIGRCLQAPTISDFANGDPNFKPGSEMWRVVLGMMYWKSDALLNWIIGHEIGHVAHGDAMRANYIAWSPSGLKLEQTLGNRIEIEADDYSFRSMFRDDPDRVAFFYETFGILAYHMRYDRGQTIFYRPHGHPPMQARLYNAWYIFKKYYAPYSFFTSDDDHIISFINKADWKANKSSYKQFCRDTEGIKYKYPMVFGAKSAGYELVRSLILGWIYRNQEWSAEILREITDNRTILNDNRFFDDDTFLSLLKRLNALIFATDQSTKTHLSSEVFDVVKDGLPDTDEVVSVFAEFLASSVYQGTRSAKNLNSPRSIAAREMFDKYLTVLRKFKLASGEDVASLAMSEALLLLASRQDSIGSRSWAKIMMNLIEDADAEDIELIMKYLEHWLGNPHNLEALKRGDISERAIYEWNVASIAYVAASYGNYSTYAEKYRRDQFEYAQKSGFLRPEVIWQMYYEITVRLRWQDSDEAMRRAQSALSQLGGEKTTEETQLPSIDGKWKSEFGIRFSNLIGSILTTQKSYKKAIEVLKPSELVAESAGCIWVRQNEQCVGDMNPTTVFIWDNLAEDYLALGRIVLAKHFSGLSTFYRNRASREPGFKGLSFDVAFDSDKVLAGWLLLGDSATRPVAIKAIKNMSANAVAAMFPRRPSKAMFTLDVSGKSINLITKLPEKPEWVEYLDNFDSSLKSRLR